MVIGCMNDHCLPLPYITSDSWIADHWDCIIPSHVGQGAILKRRNGPILLSSLIPHRGRLVPSSNESAFHGSKQTPGWKNLQQSNYQKIRIISIASAHARRGNFHQFLYPTADLYLSLSLHAKFLNHPSPRNRTSESIWAYCWIRRLKNPTFCRQKSFCSWRFEQPKSTSSDDPTL